MIADDFPAAPAGRPVWLVTLADLALLLVGFFVLVQAHRLDGRAIADGMRAGFGVSEPAPAPMPVAAAGLDGFAPGSAALPRSPAALAAWARDALADPRTALRVTGATDGSRADVDPATGSGAVLAADRARAVAAALAAAGAAPSDRLLIATAAPGPGAGRGVSVTLAFAGIPASKDPR